MPNEHITAVVKHRRLATTVTHRNQHPYGTLASYVWNQIKLAVSLTVVVARTVCNHEADEWG